MEHNIRHAAIIMDGNRTWATEHGLPKLMGHTEAIKAGKRMLRGAIERKIPYLTAWILSTENLNRSEEELAHLFSLIEKVPEFFDEFMEHNMRFNTIGDLSRIPEKAQKTLNDFKEKTSNNNGLVFSLAVAYGGRDEIVRATRKIIDQGLKPEEVNEESFEKFLDTAGIPEVDLIIRTGGHQRLSGYLPWQSTYAEIYFTSVRFPDFSEQELDKAIEWFNQQERKRGK